MLCGFCGLLEVHNFLNSIVHFCVSAYMQIHFMSAVRMSIGPERRRGLWCNMWVTACVRTLLKFQEGSRLWQAAQHHQCYLVTLNNQIKGHKISICARACNEARFCRNKHVTLECRKKRKKSYTVRRQNGSL